MRQTFRDPNARGLIRRHPPGTGIAVTHPAGYPAALVADLRTALDGVA
ncbi:hypothetical protein [Nocardia sp. NPDC046763]